MAKLMNLLGMADFTFVENENPRELDSGVIHKLKNRSRDVNPVYNWGEPERAPEGHAVYSEEVGTAAPRAAASHVICLHSQWELVPRHTIHSV